MKINLMILFPVSLALTALFLSGCGSVKEQVKKKPFEYITEIEPEQVNREAEVTGSLWKSGKGLFADRRAKSVNDIITISIVESSSATRQAKTSTSRDTSIDGDVTNLLGLQQAFVNSRFDPTNMLALQAAKSFDGVGSTSRSGNLTGTITAIVREVFPNGIMRIEGRRVVTVNNEDQYIMISGLVRRDDVASNNTVLSTKVADAVIEYSGEGVVGREQKPGWLSNFVDIIWPF